jgi:hypothetical protein
MLMREGATISHRFWPGPDAVRESQASAPPASCQKHWYGMQTDGISRIEITTEIASVVIPPYSAC